MHIITAEAINNLTSYQTVYFSCEETPLGPVWIASTSYGVCKLNLSLPGEREFLGWLAKVFPQADVIYDGDRHKPVVQALAQYSKGVEHALILPLHLIGTPFQLKVWQELLNIPFGTTLTYGELSKILDSHPRAIGQANAKNPVMLFVPCHRVIGGGGKLTGYAGGLMMKTKLLELETGVRFFTECNSAPSINL